MKDWTEYLEVNSSLGKPYVYQLTTRGFYSEVNCLLLAMMYTLLKNRRLIVDVSHFGGLEWGDFFQVPLPGFQDGDLQDRVRFDMLPLRKLVKFASRRNGLSIPVWFGKEKRLRSIFSLKSELARMMHIPSFEVEKLPELTTSPYCAIQIRRGDKIQGYEINGELVVEGDDTGIEQYANLIEKYASKYEKVFVLTDDYSYFLKLRDSLPKYKFLTLSDPSGEGYDNKKFQDRSLDFRRTALQRLVGSVDIAGKSDFFIGPFRSNPSRMVPMLQGTRQCCISADSAKRWKAN